MKRGVSVERKGLVRPLGALKRPHPNLAVRGQLTHDELSIRVRRSEGSRVHGDSPAPSGNRDVLGPVPLTADQRDAAPGAGVKHRTERGAGRRRQLVVRVGKDDQSVASMFKKAEGIGGVRQRRVDLVPLQHARPPGLCMVLKPDGVQCDGREIADLNGEITRKPRAVGIRVQGPVEPRGVGAEQRCDVLGILLGPELRAEPLDERVARVLVEVEGEVAQVVLIWGVHVEPAGNRENPGRANHPANLVQELIHRYELVRLPRGRQVTGQHDGVDGAIAGNDLAKPYDRAPFEMLSLARPDDGGSEIRKLKPAEQIDHRSDASVPCVPKVVQSDTRAVRPRSKDREIGIPVPTDSFRMSGRLEFRIDQFSCDVCRETERRQTRHLGPCRVASPVEGIMLVSKRVDARGVQTEILDDAPRGVVCTVPGATEP